MCIKCNEFLSKHLIVILEGRVKSVSRLMRNILKPKRFQWFVLVKDDQLNVSIFVINYLQMKKSHVSLNRKHWLLKFSSCNIDMLWFEFNYVVIYLQRVSANNHCNGTTKDDMLEKDSDCSLIIQPCTINVN